LATTSGWQPSVSQPFFGRPLPGEAVAALLEAFVEGRAAGESRELDFMPWGGAYNRRRPEETAFVHRDERFPAQARRDGARRRPLPEQGRGPPGGHPVVGVGPRLGLWPGVPELRRSRPGALGAAYYGSNYSRLVRVKATTTRPTSSGSSSHYRQPLKERMSKTTRRSSAG